MSLLRLHPDDNVAVALLPLAAGETIARVVVTNNVPAMHKLAVRAIACGERVVKYGQPIGIASSDIRAVEHVQVHNCGILGVGITSVAPAGAGNTSRAKP